jgi:peptidoglycan/xylan/chitin deacetylase (PgdA/CDA1 family)
MKLVSPLLKHAVYPGLAQTGYLRRHAESGLAVVTYHGVSPAGYRTTDPQLDGNLVTASSLRAQIRLLQKNYNVISPERFRGWCQEREELPPHAVLLTCDDGLQNNLSDMAAVLDECAVACMFFVTGASAGDAPATLWYEDLYLMFLAAPANIHFDLPDADVQVVASSLAQKRAQWGGLVHNLSRYDRETRREMLEQIREKLGLEENWQAPYIGTVAGARRFELLKAAQLKQLAAAGNSIGAHTSSHPMLSQLPENVARDEIVQSRGQLEKILGRPVWALAYPFGDPASVTAREERLAEQAGYQCAFVNAGGGFGAKIPHFAVPRVHVAADMSLAEFEAHVSGFYRLLRQRFARDQNLVGMTAHA